MLNWLHKLLFGKMDEAIEQIRYQRAVENDKQKTEIMRLNRQFKILLDEGSVEIIIKNVKGVIENESK